MLELQNLACGYGAFQAVHGLSLALRPRLPTHVWVPDAVLQGLARWHALRIA